MGMKKLALITILLTVFSFNSYAEKTCVDDIGDRIFQTKKDIDTNTPGYIFLGAATPALIFSYTGLGIVIGALTVGDIVQKSIKKNSLKRVIRVIEASYDYVETGRVDKMLRKLRRKISRKVNAPVEYDQLARSIIAANENRELCEARSLTHYARLYKVELED